MPALRDILLTLFYGRTCLRLEMVDEAVNALRKVESSGYDSPLLRALLGEAGYRRERYEEACEEYRQAMAMARVTTPVYKCERCGHEAEGWAARCPSCRSWNSLAVPSEAEALALASAPRYEGIA